jgi:hypothetical protein
MANMRSRLRSNNILLRVDRALRLSHKRYWMPPPENPHGVPGAVMKALAAEGLPLDPVQSRAAASNMWQIYRIGGLSAAAAPICGGGRLIADVAARFCEGLAAGGRARKRRMRSALERALPVVGLPRLLVTPVRLAAYKPPSSFQTPQIFHSV